MLRRLHVQSVTPGQVTLDDSEAHHARDVLRLSAGDAVEVFDSSGAAGDAVIERCDAAGVTVRVEQIREATTGTAVTIASAVPKGDRADWMIEKLSELGVERFIPLRTARSVVHPSGTGKLDRWQRIATESAKQSRRPGVMRIDPLTDLDAALVKCGARDRKMPAPLCILLAPIDGIDALTEKIRLKIAESDRDTSKSGPETASSASHPSKSVIQHSSSPLWLFVGPEGGWTDSELRVMAEAGLTPARLTATILRVETAAIAAAAIACSMLR